MTTQHGYDDANNNPNNNTPHAAFAAVLAQFVYGKKISKAKWLCLPIVIGGVILASVKELDFAWSALIAACIGNMFAAVKGNENKKLMDTPGIKDRLGNVGNQVRGRTP